MRRAERWFVRGAHRQKIDREKRHSGLKHSSDLQIALGFALTERTAP